MVTIVPINSGDSSQSESKKPRASKPKVRSGCVTCKKRRVKCDETRPACHRCCKFGRICGGYLSDKKDKESKPKAPKTEKPLLPKSEGEASIPLEPTTQLFQNEQAYSYFNLFAGQTSKELSGVFELPVWNRIVLQASYEHPYIRDAIITIGNLSKSVKTALTSPQPNLESTHFGTSELSPPVTERDLALWHYQKFLAGSRWAVTNGVQDTRLTLIVCILVVCIETLQWHHHQALSHIWSGMDLLEEWLSTRTNAPSSVPGISSPSPLIIEDKLFQQIRMLDAECSLLCDPRPQSYHERLRHEGSSTIQSMPELFTNIEQSRLYLDLILRRTHHFISAVRPNKTGRSVIPSEFESPGLRTHFDTLEPFDGRYNGSSETLHRERELYAYDIIRWNASFTPLYTAIAPPEHEFLAFQMLKIRSNVLTIMLYGELATTEMVYDSFIPEFDYIMRLAREFLGHVCTPKFQAEGSFGSNSGLIQPLYLVAAKCRDAKLRREAIQLLGSKAWREGPWWSLSTAQVGNWLVGIEEEGMSGGEIGEASRARLLSVDFREVEGERGVSVSAVLGNGEVRMGDWNWSLRPDVMECEMDGNIDPNLRGGAGLYN